jgi:hypothetical protein
MLTTPQSPDWCADYSPIGNHNDVIASLTSARRRGQVVVGRAWLVGIYQQRVIMVQNGRDDLARC